MTDQLFAWRVSETGRTAHLIRNGEAACGEPGVRWRSVSGVAQCPLCQQTLAR